MKKYVLLFIVTALFFNAPLFAKPKPIPENRHAIEISIGGNGMAVDMVAYKKLRQLIGSAIANSVIDKFIIAGYGKEGGFSACVEDRPSSQAPSKAFERFVVQLNHLKPNPNTSFYSVTRLVTCPPLAVKNDTVRIAKSDGGLQCQNNAISVSDMQMELGDIAVYSATKENDGKMRIALCDSPAGNFNVYEIANSDLAQALSLGFSEWAMIVAP